MNPEVVSMLRKAVKVYGNKMPVYGNKMPVYFNEEYVLEYVKENRPDIYAEIEQFNKSSYTNDAAYTWIYEALSQFIETAPEEYKPYLHILLGVIIMLHISNKDTSV